MSKDYRMDFIREVEASLTCIYGNKKKAGDRNPLLLSV